MSWFVLSLVLSIGPALYAGYLALRYRQDRDYWYGRCQWWHDHAGRLAMELTQLRFPTLHTLSWDPENDPRAAKLLLREMGMTMEVWEEEDGP